MFYKSETTIMMQQHQQLSHLIAVFSSYKHWQSQLIATTSLSTIIEKFDGLLSTHHPKLSIRFLFNSLHYEALFAAESPEDKRLLHRLLKVHQTLKVPIDGGNERMNFLSLMDAAKKAMEEQTLDSDTTQIILWLIAHQRQQFETQAPAKNQFYGSTVKVESKNRGHEEHKHSVIEQTYPVSGLANTFYASLFNPSNAIHSTPIIPSQQGYTSI